MKRIFIFLSVLLVTTISMYAQGLQDIKLNEPSKSRGSDIMKTLSDRQSIREYDTKELSLQDLSDLLWAANGINRPDGRRTAPSAINMQEIDVYLINKDGAYFYDHTTHTLKGLTPGDYRKAVAASQEWAATAPVSIVLVGNYEKFKDPAAASNRITAAMDAGIVSQNINVFCAATGMATVTRGTMNKDELKTILKLPDTKELMLNNPVGFPKK